MAPDEEAEFAGSFAGGSQVIRGQPRLVTLQGRAHRHDATAQVAGRVTCLVGQCGRLTSLVVYSRRDSGRSISGYGCGSEFETLVTGSGLPCLVGRL